MLNLTFYQWTKKLKNIVIVMPKSLNTKTSARGRITQSVYETIYPKGLLNLHKLCQVEILIHSWTRLHKCTCQVHVWNFNLNISNKTCCHALEACRRQRDVLLTLYKSVSLRSFNLTKVAKQRLNHKDPAEGTTVYNLRWVFLRTPKSPNTSRHKYRYILK